MKQRDDEITILARLGSELAIVAAALPQREADAALFALLTGVKEEADAIRAAGDLHKGAA